MIRPSTERNIPKITWLKLHKCDGLMLFIVKIVLDSWLDKTNHPAVIEEDDP